MIPPDSVCVYIYIYTYICIIIIIIIIIIILLLLLLLIIIIIMIISARQVVPPDSLPRQEAELRLHAALGVAPEIDKNNESNKQYT